MVLAPLLALLLWLGPGTALGATRYVSTNSPTPAWPYTSWATAAHAIQSAVGAAQAGDTVLVASGTYDTGGKAVYGTMTNRVSMDKAITVQSVNGPGVTWIVGAGLTNGPGAIRCAYVGTNAILSGFTLSGGRTRISGDNDREQSGGGVWCEMSGVVTNCTLSGNSAYDNGAGSYGGTLNNCTLAFNSAYNIGGGSYGGTLNNCTLTDNYGYYGGGSYGGTLNNCTLTGNSAIRGGGAYDASLNNCTLTGNSASFFGGGSYGGTLNNCIVYYNTAAAWPNYDGGTFTYSCSTPLPSGIGNIGAEPLFVNRFGGADLRLMEASPCIDTGSDSFVQPGWVDLDGKPRIVGAHVDMGAYECGEVDTNRPAFVGLNYVTNQVAYDGNVSMFVTLAPNFNPPSFQWYLNGSSPLPGQTSSNLTLMNVRLNDAGVYAVVVSNRFGSVTGAVMKLIVTFWSVNPIWTPTNSIFSLDVYTELERAYWLEARDDLETGGWWVIGGLTNREGWSPLMDTSAPGPRRFYRVGSAPWP